MILEVLYNNPLPIGSIIACVIGLLIGVGLFVGNTIMIKTEQYKKDLEMLKKLDEKIKEQTGRSVFTHQIKQLERQKAEKKEEVNTKKK